MSDSITVTVAKYDKFKGRKDVEHPSWFKLSNDFLSDPDFYEFTFAEKCAWIWVLSQASKKQSATVIIGFEHAMRAASLEKDVILSAVTKLKEIGAVTSALRPRNVRVTSTLPREEKKREEERREDKPKPPSADDLFELWNQKRGPLPAAQDLTDDRRKKANAQLAKEPSLSHYESVMAKWTASDFCTTQWRPGFDDLMSASKRAVTLEGKYDNRIPKPGYGAPVKPPMGPAPTQAIRLNVSSEPPESSRELPPEDREASLAKIRDLLSKTPNLNKQGAS